MLWFYYSYKNSEKSISSISVAFRTEILFNICLTLHQNYFAKNHQCVSPASVRFNCNISCRCQHEDQIPNIESDSELR